MWTLSWISEAQLTQICKEILEEGEPKTATLSYANVIDPFSALFDMTVTHATYDEWVKYEIIRQHQKTLQNAIGNFHQRVLGSIEGWEDLGVGEGIDIKNDSKKIIAEVKNKFNTVKGSDRIKIYNVLSRWRGASHKEYTAYFVQILTKKRFDKPFTPSDNEKDGASYRPNEKVREIDGKSFYAMVTGDPDALEHLYTALPYVLEKLRPQAMNAEEATKNPYFKDFMQHIQK